MLKRERIAKIADNYLFKYFVSFFTDMEENNKANKKDINTVTEEKKDDCDFTSTFTTGNLN